MIRKFDTGAVRGANDQNGVPKEDYIESISWLALKRFASYMTEKAAVYGRGNWIKGIPIEEYEKSMLRHWQKYVAKKYYGVDEEPDTDHLAAMLFNLQGILHEEEKIKFNK